MNKHCIYFVSDMHFGIPDRDSSFMREELFIDWLNQISKDATDLFIMGDMFDFWFEWKHVVPRGYIRLLGKLAELSDNGINLHFFIGNHDMWMFDYFEKELKAKIYRKNQIIELQEKKLLLSHGDGLGPGDNGYKFIKAIFRNKISQWFYARLHPNFATALALFFSNKSRYSNIKKNTENHQRERQLTVSQVVFAKETLKNEHIDYFIFGHQHTPEKEDLSQNSTLYNIGNWITDFSYLKLENGKISQEKFERA